MSDDAPRLFIVSYLDEDVDVDLVSALRNKGYDAYSVRDVGRRTLGDEDQLQFAADRNWMLVTHNIRDFEKLHRAWMKQGKNHAGGEMVMMAGASHNHNLIAGNVYLALRQKSSNRGCTAYMADVRLRIDKDNAYVYPDVMLVCGKVETDPRQQETVMNPVVLVEVLSDSTAGYDRNQKFKLYRNIPSLEHYVMIDQAEPYIGAYRREGRFWVLETLEGLDAALKLRALDSEISLQEIYAQLDWS